jgi:hypothetical protein
MDGGREREGGGWRGFATGRDRGHGWGSESRGVGGRGRKEVGHDGSGWGDEYGVEYPGDGGGGEGGQWSAGVGGGGSYDDHHQHQQQPDMIIDWRWRARLVGHRGQRVKRLMDRTEGRVMMTPQPQNSIPELNPRTQRPSNILLNWEKRDCFLLKPRI